jgi:hypothetical protein
MNGKAALPVLSVDAPLFVYANVVYELPEPQRAVLKSDCFTLSSRVLSASPGQMCAAGVRATDQRERMIDDGTRGWRDWYCLNWGHPPLWTATTRKLKDPKWQGPDGAGADVRDPDRDGQHARAHVQLQRLGRDPTRPSRGRLCRGAGTEGRGGLAGRVREPVRSRGCGSRGDTAADQLAVGSPSSASAPVGRSFATGSR